MVLYRNAKNTTNAWAIKKKKKKIDGEKIGL